MSANEKKVTVNKADLVDKMAESADIPKTVAVRAINSLIETIEDTLKKGGVVSLVGFGSFSVKERAAYKGRNPQTGDPIEISAANIPRFRAGKAFRDLVN